MGQQPDNSFINNALAQLAKLQTQQRSQQLQQGPFPQPMQRDATNVVLPTTLGTDPPKTSQSQAAPKSQSVFDKLNEAKDSFSKADSSLTDKANSFGGKYSDNAMYDNIRKWWMHHNDPEPKTADEIGKQIQSLRQEWLSKSAEGNLPGQRSSVAALQEELAIKGLVGESKYKSIIKAAGLSPIGDVLNQNKKVDKFIDQENHWSIKNTFKKPWE